MAKIGDGAYEKLWQDHGISCADDLVNKWEDGFREIFLTATFIPLINDKVAAAAATIDKAQLVELLAMDVKTRRAAVKAIDKKGFGPLGAKRVCDPLDNLPIKPAVDGYVVQEYGSHGLREGKEYGSHT